MSPGCTSLVGDECPLCDEFFDFVIEYNKTYKGCEFLRRFEIFKMNKMKIYSLNEKRRDEAYAYFGVNKFADLTFEEFVKTHTGSLLPVEPPETRKKRDTKNALLNATGSVISKLK